ncbi:MAG TPA: cytochrome C, partial [Planctomycetaceae bacterium]|nr:cytochrome C [Planctomycetaceae bacterium]
MKYLLVIIISLLTSALPSSLAAEDFTPENTQAANQHPLPPQLAVMRLQVPPGFQVTLAAAEPDVQQPIAIAFDDRGRLWVAESYSYNGSKFNDDRHDRILILEDTTGDGVLDRRKVFCSGLTHLTGLQLG